MTRSRPSNPVPNLGPGTHLVPEFGNEVKQAEVQVRAHTSRRFVLVPRLRTPRGNESGTEIETAVQRGRLR
jgi:hypothetical protein